MENLWAPWRVDYILGPKSGECVFCVGDKPAEDAGRLILYRGTHCFIIMNKYPYCNGHIMVAPRAHLADICDLPEQTALEFMHLVRCSAVILRKALKAQGLNIGVNLGEAAGAGVREHLHCHLVPRWPGDANFMAVLAEVRAIPQHIEDSYAALLPFFADLNLLTPFGREQPCV